MNVDYLLDNGFLPAPLIRLGIRRQLAARETQIQSETLSAAYERKMSYIESLCARPIAVETETANVQHYEVGTEVLRAALGPRMKYSCCLYPKGGEGLEEAEEEMLKLYVDRAGVGEGMKILDLGCGWGSLSLYLASRFPTSQITAFSNSRTQRTHIESLASSLSLTNLTVLTGDIATYTFDPSLHSTYDRVLSIELFEHMKNYRLLLAKIAQLLKPAGAGKCFVHLFNHATTPYDFEDGWMTTHFFTGGTMPSADLLHFFQDDLRLERQWWVSGLHYSRTCEQWLENMNRVAYASKSSAPSSSAAAAAAAAAGGEFWTSLEKTYGSREQARVWFYRWQIFYMACSELFRWKGGEVWGVSHYLFVRD